MQDSEAHFRTLLDSAPDAIVIVDPHGVISIVNSQTEKWFGYKRDELIGQPVEILVPERYRHNHVHHRSQYSSTPSTRPMGANAELYGRRKDGSEFPVEISLSPSEIDGSTWVTSIVRDVSARKQIEIERKRQEDHIQKLNQDLQRRSQELEVINRELESFSYSVSHDLRAPLRAMDGFSSTLLKEYGPQLDTRGRERLERVRAAAQRMATLIDDLLNLSRVSRSDLVWQPVDLAEVAREIVADLQQAEPQRNIQVQIEPSLRTQADRRLMTIVLTNLLNNAWKFTSHTPKPLLEFFCSRQDSTPVYCVRDNGAGFDMEFSSKLFGAFQRLHDANEFPGTGIGLATVQRIIHKHGGRIWAEGAVGRGASFFFTLKNSGDL